MTPAEIYFAKLTEQIPGAKADKMFGSLCMKIPNGKSGAMLWKDSIVVKLPGKDLDEAMNLTGAQLFEPMEGRPMKEWVKITFMHKRRRKEFAEISAYSVGSIKKKAGRK
jgi:hypothetical protein